MKTVLAATTLALLATTATARNCTPNLNYCGSTLLRIGNYQSQLNDAIQNTRWDNANFIDSDLFHCDGGLNGDIHIIAGCSLGCHDAGGGNNDFCNS